MERWATRLGAESNHPKISTNADFRHYRFLHCIKPENSEIPKMGLNDLCHITKSRTLGNKVWT